MATLGEMVFNALARQGIGEHHYKVRTDYSGRGMDGKISVLAVQLDGGPHGPASAIGKVFAHLDLACDSLGLGWVYYLRKTAPAPTPPQLALPFGQEQFDLMAALVFLRFERDPAAARAAWSRMHENRGWDATADARQEWQLQVARGLRALRGAGFVAKD